MNPIFMLASKFLRAHSILSVRAVLLSCFVSQTGFAWNQTESPCSRFPLGVNVTAPLNMYSVNGFLDVYLSYKNRTDAYGNSLYCYMMNNGQQSPTLRVKAGDHILLTLHNDVPGANWSNGMEMYQPDTNSSNCGASAMTSSSTNIHFHGINTSPACHSDQVVRTVVNFGETFTYDVAIPKNQPPGLYWYHPHIHGISEAALQGGASGAIVVEGIENIQPSVIGLPEQILIVRDNVLPLNPYNLAAMNASSPLLPGWDLSLNYIPVPFPDYTPANIPMKPSQKQFWRVVNAGADAILNLQVQYDGVPQAVEVIALDGIPVNSNGGSRIGTPLTQTSVYLPPAGRAEFVVTGPSNTVKNATLFTLNIDTGPDGDNDPMRALAQIIPDLNAVVPPAVIPSSVSSLNSDYSAIDLAQRNPDKQRVLYFSEVLTDPSDPNSPTNFYITEEGATPTLFDMNEPPAITVQQGTIEDWVIENRALERHEFHIHQLHFLVLERNGVPVPPEQQQYLDTVDLPYWSGNPSDPYPSVKVRMDFTGKLTGESVYHCHILGHEDAGMMAIIEILPRLSHDHHVNPWLISTFACVGVIVAGTAGGTGAVLWHHYK